jgi:hypothetical protein
MRPWCTLTVYLEPLIVLFILRELSITFAKLGTQIRLSDVPIYEQHSPWPKYFVELDTHARVPDAILMTSICSNCVDSHSCYCSLSFLLCKSMFFY